MKYILAFCLITQIWGLPQNYNAPTPIVRQDFELNPDGTHNYLYETGNGIYEDQQGYVRGPDLQGAQGQFQYVSPEGKVIRTTYTADENGFQAQGDHLPTPPPIPEAIQRALKLIARLPARV